MKSKTLIPFGPTSIGKGYLGKALQMAVGSNHFTLTVGELIRKEIDLNPKFKERYGGSIARGELLPDDEVTHLIKPEIKKVRGFKSCYQDGYHRTPNQVYWAVENGFLHNDCIVIVLDAKKSTCYKRLLRRKNRPDGMQRIDNDAFEHRWENHLKNYSRVLNSFAKAEVKMYYIDANPDLPEVALDILVRLADSKFLNISDDFEYLVKCANLQDPTQTEKDIEIERTSKPSTNRLVQKPIEINVSAFSASPSAA